MRQVLPYFCSLPWSQQVRPVSIPVLIIPWRQELEPNYWLVCNAPAPVVWIGGSEPLLHPEMGQLTRCIAAIGRDVFLETDGALLRRRIHEFRPVSRCFSPSNGTGSNARTTLGRDARARSRQR